MFGYVPCAAVKIVNSAVPLPLVPFLYFTLSDPEPTIVTKTPTITP